MRVPPTRDVALRAARAVALAALLAPVAACGSMPPESPPSGVDELVVPTPSPDPADFVDEVDNPWLPLLPGARWTRRVTGPEGIGTEEVQVAPGTRTLAGVAATEVRTSAPDGTEHVAWFAQDRRGNVWLLAEQGAGEEWEAGVADAQAGLAMPARPRRGDGFARWGEGGEAREVVRVGEREASATVPAGRFTDLLETTWTDADGDTWQVWSAEGVGEVLRLAADGSGRSELVEHDAGR